MDFTRIQRPDLRQKIFKFMAEVLSVQDPGRAALRCANDNTKRLLTPGETNASNERDVALNAAATQSLAESHFQAAMKQIASLTTLMSSSKFPNAEPIP